MAAEYMEIGLVTFTLRLFLYIAQAEYLIFGPTISILI